MWDQIANGENESSKVPISNKKTFKENNYDESEESSRFEESQSIELD
jgi:hypothetical protein